MSDEVQGTLEPETIVDNQATETEAEANDIVDVLETEAETAEQKEPEAEQNQPRKLKVKIDGQEFEVDEDEAARGYQRQADYSRHMQQLQAERQQAQQLQTRYQQQLEQFIPESVARINALQQAAEQYRNEGNTEALALVQYDLNAEIMRYQNANAENKRIQSERAQESELQNQQALKMAEQVVLEIIPEWKNPKIREAEVKEVTKVLGDFVGKYYGDQAPQILSAIDKGFYGPMPVILARKAMLYDKLMAKVAARKAGKSEETSAPAPVQSVRTSGGSAEKDPAEMSPKEFAAWRRRQIANR